MMIENEMPDTSSAVFGVYSTHAALEAAVDALRAKGFRNADISVLSGPNPGFSGFTPDTDPPTAASPSAASAVGATLGWLVGLGALAMASGVFIVAGPIMGVLAHMGEKAGDIVGALSGFGIPETQAKQYEGRVVSGDILLSVHTRDLDRLSHVKHILEQTGAEEITSVLDPLPA
jgi:hypothetical protein